MKEETRLAKQKIKDEIRDKYKPYLDLLVASGGALNLKDFSILLNLDYTKTTRDLKFIEENTNIIKSYKRIDISKAGTPKNSKVICLTRAGWKYLTDKSRNEVKFENEATMENIRLKAYEYVNLSRYREKNIAFKEKLLEIFGNASDVMNQKFLFDGEEIIDIDKFFKETKFTLTTYSSPQKENENENIYKIKATYTCKRLYAKNFLEDMDFLIAILEYIYFSTKEMDSIDIKFDIKVDCIVINKPDIALFVHLKNLYKRKYHYFFTTDINIGYKNRRKFKTIFKEVYKRVDFYKLEDDYTLTCL